MPRQSEERRGGDYKCQSIPLRELNYSRPICSSAMMCDVSDRLELRKIFLRICVCIELFGPGPVPTLFFFSGKYTRLLKGL